MSIRVPDPLDKQAEPDRKAIIQIQSELEKLKETQETVLKTLEQLSVTLTHTDLSGEWNSLSPAIWVRGLHKCIEDLDELKNRVLLLTYVMERQKDINKEH